MDSKEFDETYRRETTSEGRADYPKAKSSEYSTSKECNMVNSSMSALQSEFESRHGVDWSIIENEYEKNGYYIVENLLKEEEVELLLSETIEIGRGKRGFVKGMENIGNQNKNNEYEEDIFSQLLAIHHPHKVSSTIRNNFMTHPRIREILSHLIGPNIKSMQSMLFIKPAGKPGQAWHQDEYYIPTRDASLTGVWIALDDATIENGCLWVRPGSHKDKIIYETAPHGSYDFDSGTHLINTPNDNDEGIPCEVKRGSAIIFNGYLHHRSLPNRARKGTYRRALVNHYLNANSMLPWDCDGTISPTRDMRDIILVNGIDPYAWKGTENITSAFLRAETAKTNDPNRGNRQFF